MLGLPKATELNKQLPKNAIYAKFQMNTAERAKIDADISRITIVNEVSPAKINIADGEQVKSFFVLLVALKMCIRDSLLGAGQDHDKPVRLCGRNLHAVH